MQYEQQFFPEKPSLPLADQLGGGYMRNAPNSPFFGGSILPPVQKHLVPFHGINFQSSEACPRNFIICDQTDNQSQIMFHPSINPKLCYPGLNVSFPSFQDGAKRNDASETYYLKEDSDDIDALLSSEEEQEEECDEEEVSTARTHGNCGSDSHDSCSSHGSRSRKSTFPSLSQKSISSGRTNCSGRKRQKVRKMVKALRRIVPGAQQMDTTAVLDEAVRYLKSLKVEVQKLGVGV